MSFQAGTLLCAMLVCLVASNTCEAQGIMCGSSVLSCPPDGRPDDFLCCQYPDPSNRTAQQFKCCRPNPMSRWVIGLISASSALLAGGLLFCCMCCPCCTLFECWLPRDRETHVSAIARYQPIPAQATVTGTGTAAARPVYG